MGSARRHPDRCQEMLLRNFSRVPPEPPPHLVFPVDNTKCSRSYPCSATNATVLHRSGAGPRHHQAAQSLVCALGERRRARPRPVGEGNRRRAPSGSLGAERPRVPGPPQGVAAETQLALRASSAPQPARERRPTPPPSTPAPAPLPALLLTPTSGASANAPSRRPGPGLGPPAGSGANAEWRGPARRPPSPRGSPSSPRAS